MERLQKVREVIFDQDGLMFDTERISAEAWNLAGQEMGVVLEEEFLCTIRGMCLTDSDRRLAEMTAQLYRTVVHGIESVK